MAIGKPFLPFLRIRLSFFFQFISISVSWQPYVVKTIVGAFVNSYRKPFIESIAKFRSYCKKTFSEELLRMSKL